MDNKQFVVEKVLSVSIIDENDNVISKCNKEYYPMHPFYDSENPCRGCVYEDADGSTTAISNCVCCSRNVDFAKNDYYKRKQI